jgi:sulfite exporter TauE/SafE
MPLALELMTYTPVVAVLVYGFCLGLKHATEADHVIAISIVVAERQGIARSAWVGAWWGIGHTISLLAAGIIVLVLEIQISDRLENLLEMFVGVMLVLLGLNVLRKLLKGGKLHIHTHEHGGHLHAHPHMHDSASTREGVTAAGHHAFGLNRRSLAIGMLHGLAGSAALMLLVIPTIDSRAVGLLYIAVFGVGSIAGMTVMTLIVSLPLHFASIRINRVEQWLQAVTGLAGLGLGLWKVYEHTLL